MKLFAQLLKNKKDFTCFVASRASVRYEVDECENISTSHNCLENPKTPNSSNSSHRYLRAFVRAGFHFALNSIIRCNASNSHLIKSSTENHSFKRQWIRLLGMNISIRYRHISNNFIFN